MTKPPAIPQHCTPLALHCTTLDLLVLRLAVDDWIVSCRRLRTMLDETGIAVTPEWTAQLDAAHKLAHRLMLLRGEQMPDIATRPAPASPAASSDPAVSADFGEGVIP